MKLKVVTLHFDPGGGGFDGAELEAFQRGKEVLEVRDHFFVHETIPRWALMIAYREEEGEARERSGRTSRRDWRLEVADEDRALFDALRSWRNERALREGVPGYVLLTNRHLAEICRVRPASVAELRTVRGIGEAKSRSLGEEVLAVVAATPPSAPEGRAGEEEPERSDG